MGRNGNWFSTVKKALNPEQKEDNNQPPKSKKKWFKKKKNVVANTHQPEPAPATITAPPSPTLPPVAPPIEPPKLSAAKKEQTAKHAYTNPIVEQARPSGVDKEQKKHAYSVASPIEPPKLSAAKKGQTAKHAYTIPIVEQARPSGVDKEQTKHAYSVALATAKAAEAAVAAAHAAAEVVRLTTAGPFADVSIEEVAAIKIQTLFRGYMARRRLRAIRGVVRLRTMMQGAGVRRQNLNTLKCMQTLTRMQIQIRERRLRMAEEHLARQIQHKNAKEQARELEKSQQSGDGWDASGKTKEQIEARLQNKHEAAIRRERTLAYAFSHQQTWKASARSATTLFMDSNNPHWGWSWLERWLAARPWESATIMESSNENSPRTKALKSTISGEEILKAYTRRHNSQKPSPTSAAKQPRPSTARLSTSSARKPMGSPSPKACQRASMWSQDNDETGSSVRDDESQASSQNVPSYMAPTEAAKARSRFAGEIKRDKSVTPDRSSISSTKKRGSYTASPARSRRSTSSAADATSISDNI